MIAIKVKVHEAFNRCYRTVGRVWLGRQLANLRPLAPQISLADADTICVVMGAKRTRVQHVFTSYLWRKFLPPCVPVVMVCDAPLDAGLRAIVTKLFSGAEHIIDAKSLFSNLQSDRIKQFAEVHRFGRKFLAIYSFSQSHDVIYSDDDILVFDEPREFLEAKKNAFSYLYSPDVSGVPYAIHQGIAKVGSERNVMPLADFQAGLLYVRKEVIPQKLVETFLSGWAPDNDVHFAEQTLFAILFSSVGGGGVLPGCKYINDPATGRFFGGEDFDYSVRPVLRHYMGTVRHRYFQMANRMLREQKLC